MSIANELRAMGERLIRLADEQANDSRPEETSRPEGTRRPARTDPEVMADHEHLGRLAEALLRVRRLRDVHFDPRLFSDPAWDLLLDFYIHKVAGKRVSVSSACIAANVPGTTALRWISVLEEEGLIRRDEDETDRRRVFLSLTKKGELALVRYLIAMGRHLRVPFPVPFMLLESSLS